jgi:hypothetical protein
MDPDPRRAKNIQFRIWIRYTVEPVLQIRDLVLFFTPGYGMEKNRDLGSGIDILDHIFARGW